MVFNLIKIALVSCTKIKQVFPCDARTMYSKSPLFSKIVRFVEQREYTDWYIMSAKYGLITKDQIIDPYDITLNKLKSAQRKAWAELVFKAISDLDVTEIDFYAGKKYREYLIPLLEMKHITCNVPLQRLGIGEQLKYLSKNLLLEN